jgi:hypothetical protein
LLAAEFGFRECEKGHNLQAMQASARRWLHGTSSKSDPARVGPAPQRLADRADKGERILVIVVEGDGCPEAVLCPWSEARSVLCKLFYGDGDTDEAALGWPHPERKREEFSRWARFSNFDYWSVDQNGKPFGYEGGANHDNRLRAFFLTGPDVLFMRRS